MKKLAVEIPRLSLTPPEAAAAIGVGVDWFDEHVAPEVRIVRRGSKRLISVPELEKWLVDNSEASIAEQVG